MATALKNLSEYNAATIPSGEGRCFVVIVAEWNEQVTNAMAEGAIKTLKDNGVGDILEIKSGEMRINPDKLDSDLYQLINGNARAINEYRGEYMSSYYWASITEAALSRQTEKMLDI